LLRCRRISIRCSRAGYHEKTKASCQDSGGAACSYSNSLHIPAIPARICTTRAQKGKGRNGVGDVYLSYVTHDYEQAQEVLHELERWSVLKDDGVTGVPHSQSRCLLVALGICYTSIPGWILKVRILLLYYSIGVGSSSCLELGMRCEISRLVMIGSVQHRNSTDICHLQWIHRIFAPYATIMKIFPNTWHAPCLTVGSPQI